jgi:DNA ligase D-like protein (predicted 3'-phosphoesterase)
MSNRYQAYRRKRNFRRQRDPLARDHHNSGRFVIQKQDASGLRYDFHLEIGGVLVSWAVPKGLSADPRDKRIAIQTEDHPVDFIDFEGIRQDEQSGTLPVWDSGHYQVMKAGRRDARHSAENAFQDGLIEVWLEGRRIKGGYAVKRIDRGKKRSWLIIKMNDEYVDTSRRPAASPPEPLKNGPG